VLLKQEYFAPLVTNKIKKLDYSTCVQSYHAVSANRAGCDRSHQSRGKNVPKQMTAVPECNGCCKNVWHFRNRLFGTLQSAHISYALNLLIGTIGKNM
jgi:hypothetical protein